MAGDDEDDQLTDGLQAGDGGGAESDGGDGHNALVIKEESEH
jgi:hypothetical protein